jgi:predicted alpha/beta hydrolase
MDLLVFKLVVTPLLLLAASFASRRWGEAIGGFLVGLPLTSGPISVFLAVEHGPAFAAHATSGSLAATAAQAGFCVAYFRLAVRSRPHCASKPSSCIAHASRYRHWASERLPSQLRGPAAVGAHAAEPWRLGRVA